MDVTKLYANKSQYHRRGFLSVSEKYLTLTEIPGNIMLLKEEICEQFDIDAFKFCGKKSYCNNNTLIIIYSGSSLHGN